MMSDVTVPSRYVKLTKDQDVPLEEIRPGELNQPVRVPQVRVFNVELLDSYRLLNSTRIGKISVICVVPVGGSQMCRVWATPA